MICSVRSASCQTVKATAIATVAASAHHGAVAVAGLTGALAGWLASLALACVAPASVALVSVSVASASPVLGSVGLASAALDSALDGRVSPKAGQVAGSWRTAK